MKSNIVKVSLYLLENKLNSKKMAPVYMWLKLNMKAIGLSTGIWVKPSDFDKKKSKVKGTSYQAATYNKSLTELHDKVFEIVNDLKHSGVIITLEAIRTAIRGKESTQTLITVFDDHVKAMNERKGEKGFSERSILQYGYTKIKIVQFLRTKYKSNDIGLSTLNFDFIDQFANYLVSEYKNKRNTIQKNINHLKCVVNKARKRGLIKGDPFQGYVNRGEPATNRQFLTPEEIHKIELLDTSKSERLDVVKDMFLWICYTGIAYADSKALTFDNIVHSITGKTFISYARMKTGTSGNVPLFDKAKSILDKYREHPLCLSRGTLLPFISNQKMNEYLKDIAAKAEIKKNISTHIGRHSFATTAVSLGTPLETVSKMLNHTSLKTTSIYSKITQSKLLNDTENLSRLFSNDNSGQKEDENKLKVI